MAGFAGLFGLVEDGEQFGHAAVGGGGARVADVGCGTGQALIALARAFPAITATGYDAHPPSVEQTRRAAAEGRPRQPGQVPGP